MTQLYGLNGRLNLKDSYVEFGEWAMYDVSSTPPLEEWEGNFEIRKHDFIMKVMNSDDINAEFYGDEIYKRKIALDYEVGDDPIISVNFKVLKKL
jgi:hypothetical protein